METGCVDIRCASFISSARKTDNQPHRTNVSVTLVSRNVDGQLNVHVGQPRRQFEGTTYSFRCRGGSGVRPCDYGSSPCRSLQRNQGHSILSVRYLGDFVRCAH